MCISNSILRSAIKKWHARAIVANNLNFNFKMWASTTKPCSTKWKIKKMNPKTIRETTDRSSQAQRSTSQGRNESLRKRSVFWYTHGQINRPVRLHHVQRKKAFDPSRPSLYLSLSFFLPLERLTRTRCYGLEISFRLCADVFIYNDFPFLFLSDL